MPRSGAVYVTHRIGAPPCVLPLFVSSTYGVRPLKGSSCGPDNPSSFDTTTPSDSSAHFVLSVSTKFPPRSHHFFFFVYVFLSMPVIRRSSDRARGSNIQTELFSSRTDSLGCGSAERRVGILLAPQIVDFVVELDNTNYKPEEPMCPAPSPDFSFTFTLASSYVEGEAPLHASLFENPAFESCGSYFYTRETQKHSWIPADFTYKLLSPTPFQIESDIEDVYDDAAACDRDPTKPHNDPSACMATTRVVTTYSPTSPLLYPSPPALSYPSCGSIDERDITEVTEVKEDCEHDSPVPPSFTRSNKCAAGCLTTSRAKKRRVSATPISLSSIGAVRFPCRVPGCNQVCKTQGDLKRHESILAHKPPSWECRRCHYQFTREDALKRHNKNLPNCINAKTNPRGRFASMKRQIPDVACKIETTQN